MLNRLFSAKPAVPEIDVAGLAAAQTADTSLQVVDVREPDEWAAGHMPGAVLIPLEQLGIRSHELDPARPVVVVCRSGNRSGAGTQLLLQSGFKDVKNLVGGMIAWSAAGKPVTR